MKKTIKFLACIFAVSAFAVACNNAPEEPVADTTDTEMIVDTPEVIDTPAVDSTVVETPAKATTKKDNNKNNTVQRTDPSKKLSKDVDVTTLKAGETATSTNMQDEGLKNRNAGKLGKK